mgnify:CR=1 FL=1
MIGSDVLDRLGDALRDEWVLLTGPDAIRTLGVQIALIAVAALGATVLNRALAPQLEARTRLIKGAPGLLRVLVAFLRRLRLFFFTVLLALGSVVFARQVGPRPNLVSVVLSLAAAWLTIAVVARAIRNRLGARIVTVAAWIVAALSILNLTDVVTDTFDEAAIRVGSARISLLLVLKAVTVIAATLWVSGIVGKFLDSRVQRSTELTPTLRVLIGKFLQIGLILLALAVALSSIGIDITALTVLSGAIGVGLGFGLQKVVSNFISGIIILLDRSIKPGDTISLGSTFGWVRELRARFVSVVTRDGREYLIPNEQFVTNQVVNWSFTDDLVRIDANFRAAYEADPHEVSRIAREAAATVERVVKAKGAVCWITGFGEVSVDYVVRFWIADPQNGVTNVKGQVLLALWDAFKREGIAIPYPRCEVTVRQTAGDGPAGDRASP